MMTLSVNWSILFNFIVLLNLSTASKYNISLNDVMDMGCKQYTSQNNFGSYKNEEFYKLEVLKHACIECEDDIVNLNTFVLATGDANVLLSTVEKPDVIGPAFIIAIEYGIAKILDFITGTVIAEEQISDILSATDPVPLNIRVSKYGDIIVTIKGLNKILVQASNADSLSVKFISFSSSRPGVANWFFGCKSNVYDTGEFIRFLREKAECEEYRSSGYGYQDLFDVEYNKPSDDLVNLDLYVLAEMDAHIILSSNDTLTDETTAYEIVIGAGNNTYSIIRTRPKGMLIERKDMGNVLSTMNALPLNIRVTKQGLITVNLWNRILVSAVDENPLSIKYVGFGSWYPAKATWFFDCTKEISLN